jgi:predicted transcriptional regulator
MAKHRKKLEIVADILSVAKEGAKKTHIMYDANLSFSLLSRYLDEVVTSGLINHRGHEYLLTDAGSRFLDVFSDYEKYREKLDSELRNLKDLKRDLEEMIKAT